MRRTRNYEEQHNKVRRAVFFKPGDLVWLHLRQEQFPTKRKSKLHPRGDGPFRVLERIGMNAYKLELPDSYGVHPTFNVADLSPYTDPLYDDLEQTGTFATQGGRVMRPRLLCLHLRSRTPSNFGRMALSLEPEPELSHEPPDHSSLESGTTWTS